MNRIAEVIITMPNFSYCGRLAKVAPTPLHEKSRCNSPLGIWVYLEYHGKMLIVFMSIGQFQVVRYVPKPRAEQYGFISSFKYPSLQNSMWSGNEGKILFFKHRLEYDNLA